MLARTQHAFDKHATSVVSAHLQGEEVLNTSVVSEVHVVVYLAAELQEKVRGLSARGNNWR